MIPIADFMFYIVVSAHRNGSYLPERNVSDLGCTATVNDIAAGQYGEVVQVIECNPVERICRDCTEDMLREADALREPNDEPRHHATQEQMWDWQRGHRGAA